MLKNFLILTIILFSTSIAFADEGYVSPEIYAINEADLTDYYNIPSSPRLNIDNLDKPSKTVKTNSEKPTPRKEKTHRAKGEKKPYEDRIIYKAAKWWTNQTYKFDDPHHGEKHEIKIKAREEYEKQQAEKEKETKY